MSNQNIESVENVIGPNLEGRILELEKRLADAEKRIAYLERNSYPISPGYDSPIFPVNPNELKITCVQKDYRINCSTNT